MPCLSPQSPSWWKAAQVWRPCILEDRYATFKLPSYFFPEPRGSRLLPVGELVLWYGMFAHCGRLLRTTSFAVGLHERKERKW